MSEDGPALRLLDYVQADVFSEQARRRARERAVRILEGICAELDHSGWYSDGWLDEMLHQAARRFDEACDRWRGLYRAALAQARAQDEVIRDATRSSDDKRHAERLRQEAEQQLRLLTETEDFAQSDFYSYRYFASEGFLPGYNFPRLPLSAFIPARRTRQREEYLSRPRFLAISEFGPRAVVYHEGSRYQINRVILPLQEDGVADQPGQAVRNLRLRPRRPRWTIAGTATPGCPTNWITCSACRMSPRGGGTRSTAMRRSGCGWVTRFAPAFGSMTRVHLPGPRPGSSRTVNCWPR